MRFITCGSVDDGKSTLIGRLLYETGVLYDDHLAGLAADSRRYHLADQTAGAPEGEGAEPGAGLQFALLLDGLAAEREQGITIDVAYRHFSTARRRFIVADTPGHEQYTRNMATGASTADCAVILLDARKGVLDQTRRHSFIAAALGIRQVALAVNKMDLVGYSEGHFREIEAAYRQAVAPLGFEGVTCIPVSAARGDNVVRRGDALGWYRGETVLEFLESVEVDADRLSNGPFRYPVQWVNRPAQDFRGLAGTVAGGRVRPGDPVVVLPSGRRSRVATVVTFDGEREQAVAGDAVTLTLADEVDASRGDVLAAPDSPPAVADRLRATLVWMGDEPGQPGRPYLARVGTQMVGATIEAIEGLVDMSTYHAVPPGPLAMNEIGRCRIVFDRPVVFDTYQSNRDTGGVVLVDRLSFATVAAGMIEEALSPARNLYWQRTHVDHENRASALGQRPFAVWFTGLSGAGKSTVAGLLEARLAALGRHTYLLDGDNLRHGLNRDLGFSPQDRSENIRRTAEVARLMVDAGLIVLVSLISPLRADRAAARALFDEGGFVEVHVDVPLGVAERRDPKGLYARARRGEIAEFTGISSPYEPPAAPEVRIDTSEGDPEQAAGALIDELRGRGLIG